MTISRHLLQDGQSLFKSTLYFWQLKKTYIFIFSTVRRITNSNTVSNWHLCVHDIVYALLWLSRKSRKICTLFYSSTKECITNHNSFVTEIESIRKALASAHLQKNGSLLFCRPGLASAFVIVHGTGL